MRRPKHPRNDIGTRRAVTSWSGVSWPGFRRRAVLVGLALAGLLLVGCAVPKEINPVTIYREVSGQVDEGRRPPPGLDDPFPNLASVPPRPERPTAAAREAISAALADDRSNSRDPVVVRGPRGVAPGLGPLGAGGSPQRPSLAAAPLVPWTEVPGRGAPGIGASGTGAPGTGAPFGRRPENASAPRRGAEPATARPEPSAPELPDTAPAAPPPDLLSRPPPPPADLLAPPRTPPLAR